ncbi:MAG: hypothetical protein MZV65_30045 [Chromatiales bacterium]|nr:hypothetical protein [Chromatiales bacterium]
MRSIVKGAEPRALIQWKAENAQTPENLVYGGGGFPADAVRAALLAEQFHLCAYTMKRLKTRAECQAQDWDTTASCHIEHLLPQARKVPGEDIDYRNMVACYPPSRSRIACEFGAQAKGDFDPTAGAFVSPLSPKAERHFEFDARGGITGRTPEGSATIQVLKLDHPALVNDRTAVIRGRLASQGQATVGGRRATSGHGDDPAESGRVLAGLLCRGRHRRSGLGRACRTAGRTQAQAG